MGPCDDDQSTGDIADGVEPAPEEAAGETGTAEPAPDASESSGGRDVMSRFFQAVFKGEDSDIMASFTERADIALSAFPAMAAKYQIVALLEPHNSIDSGDVDGIFGSLRENKPKDRNVLLILLSRGGSIEPAYQISKVCKEFSRDIFAVAIPRHAKSAATLIALGADEIHIGPLGQLGPIDPQLGGMPALGVAQALKTIAAFSEQYPGSSSMFAAYLAKVLTIEQVGYCDRIAESAVQYAEKLLSSKAATKEKSDAIAKRLVHHYKDHRFVIDRDEARDLLGTSLVKEGTAELELAENIYDLFEQFNFFLSSRNKKLIVAGDWKSGLMILPIKRK